jgi:hypothetical protein
VKPEVRRPFDCTVRLSTSQPTPEQKVMGTLLTHSSASNAPARSTGQVLCSVHTNTNKALHLHIFRSLSCDARPCPQTQAVWGRRLQTSQSRRHQLLVQQHAPTLALTAAASLANPTYSKQAMNQDVCGIGGIITIDSAVNVPKLLRNPWGASVSTRSDWRQT